MIGISMTRIIMRLNALYAARDIAGAERHLLYWQAEAEQAQDKDALFAIENELIGHYRKNGPDDKALLAIGRAGKLAEELGVLDTVAGATYLINAGTSLTAIGQYGRALEMLEDARRIYARETGERDIRRSYADNNTAAVYEAMGRFGEAHRLYREALELLEGLPGGEIEMAVTYLNMARACVAEHGEEKSEEVVRHHAEKAHELLFGTDTTREPEAAYVYRWCAEEFGRYGFFLYEKEANDAAEACFAEAEQ